MDPTLETVQIDGDHSIRMLHYQCAAFQSNHGWHYHPECELSYIVKGSGTRFVGDSVEQFSPGDLVFIGPNIPHCWISNEEEKESEMIVLQFSSHCLGDQFLDTPEAGALKNLLSVAKRGIHFTDSHVVRARYYLELLENAKGLKRISQFLQLLDVLCESKDTHLLASELYVADNSEFNSGRLAKVMEYVKANLSSEIKQTSVADLVCMTPQSFSRFFRATTGRTFVSFVNVLRITEACKLLVKTNRDIIDVAYECGYANLSNFNRRFSEIKKTTPSEYRRTHQLVNRAAS